MGRYLILQCEYTHADAEREVEFFKPNECKIGEASRPRVPI
jgi:hypothetical protein